jgi:vacuolar-type H+-ATPase subunit F/Vma7
MGTVVAIGPAVQVAGWALAGVDVRPARTLADARERWAALADDVTLVIVSADTAEAVAGVPGPLNALVAVLPT